jgi:hypothetical protein
MFKNSAARQFFERQEIICVIKVLRRRGGNRSGIWTKLTRCLGEILPEAADARMWYHVVNINHSADEEAGCFAWHVNC